MKKKTLVWILVAALCLAVLGVTLWTVLGGIGSVLPQPSEPPVQEPPEERQELQNPQQEEHYPMVDESGIPIEGDNFLEDPWGDVEDDSAAPQEEKVEIPQEVITSDSDLAVTDDGWSEIY